MNLLSWNTLQVKHQVSIFVVGTTIAIYLLYNFLLLPQRVHIDELTAQYNAEQQQVKVIETFLLAHPSPEQHLVELDNKLLQLDQMLPNNPEISSFLLQIEQLSMECGVQLNYLKPTKTVNKTGYREFEIEILISGNFRQVMNFLNKTETGLRFISVSNISMQLSKNTLESKLTAKIYSHGVPVTPAAAKTNVADNKN